MAQDFAKQRSNPDGGKRKRSATRPPQPGSASWSWFFSGLMTGIIVSIAAYLAVLKLEEGIAEEAQAAQAGANPEDQPAYTFYDALANAEVTVDVSEGGGAGQDGTPANATESATVNATPATTASVAATDERPARYLLQAGSFQSKDGAESRRTSIILLNMNASIAEGIVGGRTHYSVQVGPFADSRSAEDASDILSSNDIESIKLLIPQ
jgi:cell division protein FtsN